MKIERIYGMDALRAIAMFLGVVLHAAMSYQLHPSRSGWPLDHSSRSVFFDYLYLFIHSFRMPLFFLVAGFFCNLLYNKVGVKEFLKRRFTRIVIPFICGIIIIIPITAFPFIFYKSYYLDNYNLSDALVFSFTKLFQWHGLYHLWFLYYLIIYYLFTVIYREYFIKLGRIKLYIPKSKVFKGTFTVLVVWLITIVFFENAVEAWTGIGIKIGPLLYYFVYFIVGYIMYDKWETIQINQKYTWLFFLLGSISIFIYAYLINSKDSIGVIYEKLIFTISTLFLVFGSLGIFLNYLNNKNFLILYLSDSAYWIYLIHLPLVVSFQVLLVDLSLDSFSKFCIVLFLSYSIGLYSYHKLVRYSFIGLILHGPRIKRDFKILKTQLL